MAADVTSTSIPTPHLPGLGPSAPLPLTLSPHMQVTLWLLLSPITFQEDCVHALSPQQFKNLEEQIYNMHLLPRGGILRGLLRARIFPYTRLRAECSDHEMVRGKGCRNRCLVVKTCGPKQRFL